MSGERFKGSSKRGRADINRNANRNGAIDHA